MRTPEDLNTRGISRRTFLRLSVPALLGGLATIGLSCTTDRPHPTSTTAIKPTVTPTILNPEPKKEETLTSLVAKAKKMEEEFKGKDLSDKTTRTQYTNLLADIFTRYYPLGISKEQILTSVIFIDSKEEFEHIFVDKNQAPNLSTQYLKKRANEVGAITGDGKIYVNINNEAFQKQVTANNPYFPRDWNPLKSLRLALFHEFSHLISRPSEDPAVFSVVDSRNNIIDKKIDGFSMRGFTARKESVGLYVAIDEASVELLSNYINVDLFDYFLSIFPNDGQGYDVTAIMTRLEKLLDSAKIDKTQLASLHKSSNLKGVLLLLAERGGISPQKINEPDRIVFGFSLFEALMRDNQAILQDYMNSAKRFNK